MAQSPDVPGGLSQSSPAPKSTVTRFAGYNYSATTLAEGISDTLASTSTCSVGEENVAWLEARGVTFVLDQCNFDVTETIVVRPIMCTAADKTLYNQTAELRALLSQAQTSLTSDGSLDTHFNIENQGAAALSQSLSTLQSNISQCTVDNADVINDTFLPGSTVSCKDGSFVRELTINAAGAQCTVNAFQDALQSIYNTQVVPPYVYWQTWLLVGLACLVVFLAVFLLYRRRVQFRVIRRRRNLSEKGR